MIIRKYSVFARALYWGKGVDLSFFLICRRMSSRVTARFIDSISFETSARQQRLTLVSRCADPSTSFRGFDCILATDSEIVFPCTKKQWAAGRARHGSCEQCPMSLHGIVQKSCVDGVWYDQHSNHGVYGHACYISHGCQ